LQQLQLGSDVKVLRRSEYYETSPVENVYQPFFVNNVVEIETHLTAEQLLGRIKAIETLLNVLPRVNKGPRVIDIDILLFGDECCSTEQLSLPHPAICFRKFVLVPLTEINPNAISPVDQRRYDECLAELNDPLQKVEVYHG
jgi:2-amino-4-hydroxy-6-hydroxymethyldihydropteridine diphosphokinase